MVDLRGVYRKFEVHRTDGNGADACDKHYGCRYFVLDLDHDPHARAALRAYADDCRNARPQLAEDIDDMLLVGSIGDALESMMRAEEQRPDDG